MEIQFVYGNKMRHYTISLFLIILGLMLSIPTVFAFGKIPESSATDKIVFYALAIGFIIPGVGFLLFGALRYRKQHVFFSQQPWTGIRVLPNRTLICTYFNHWKVKTIEVDLARLIRWSKQSNKGQRFLLLELNDASKKVIIPIHGVQSTVLDRFTQELFSDQRGPLTFETPTIKKEVAVMPQFMTIERCRIAEALMRSLERKLQMTIARSATVIDDNEICFGDQKENPGSPKIRVRWIGEGFGDSYSGNYIYQLVYQLENGPVQPDGRNFRLDYHFEATDLAGSTSHFISRMDDIEALAFENLFYEILKSDFELPSFSIVNG